MDNDDALEFTEAMRKLDPSVPAGDIEGAISMAMNSVARTQQGMQWFGQVGDGVFYADENTWRWFPDSKPAEVVGTLTAEFGESLTNEFPSFAL